MPIYLPIAEVSVHLSELVGLGLGVGFLSGMFGVGGGFLLTPLLFMIGIPPGIAVGSQGAVIVASSISGLSQHLRRRTVDRKMGLVLLFGGLIGSAVGVRLFRILSDLGQIDLAIKISYVVLLGAIGALMLIESLAAMRRESSGKAPARKRRRIGWIHGLPFRVRFPSSGLYLSVYPPFAIGALVGVLSAIMGVGGGFLMVPAMIYVLGMPTKTVIGTSLFQISFLASATALLHAVENQTVDMVLAALLIVGGVTGAQAGAVIGQRLKATSLRILLSLMVLAISLKVLTELVLTPSELYQLAVPGGI